MNPDEYCQQKAAASGSSFYYASTSCRRRGAARSPRSYAFCREVDDVVDEVPRRGGRADEARVVAAGDRAHVRRIAAASGRAGARARRARIRAAAGALPDDHRRHGDGPRTDALSRLRRARALLPSRRGRRGTPVGGDLRLHEPGDARIRARSRRRIPAHQHLPRRRRGRAARTHLPSAGGPREVRGRRVVDPACGILAGVRRAHGVRVRSRAPIGTRRRSRSCPRRIARRSARASSWRRSTARCSHEIARDGYRVLDRKTSLTPIRKLWIAWTTARKLR